jgi:hypothetical protein
MDNPSLTSIPINENRISKNILIAILVVLLVLSFLGINVLNIFGNLIQNVIIFFTPLISQLLSIFGYTAGTAIDKTADAISTVAKGGIDIADGTLHSVGDLLINASNVNATIPTQIPSQLNKTISTGNIALDNNIVQPLPDNSTNPIQKPISSQKTNWCLVGEYQGRRGCIAITERDKCLSGQIFPSQQTCLNPAMFSNTYHPLKGVSE